MLKSRDGWKLSQVIAFLPGSSPSRVMEIAILMKYGECGVRSSLDFRVSVLVYVEQKLSEFCLEN
jgi:hypothetical protein